MRRLWVLAALAATAWVGCGGGGGASSPAPAVSAATTAASLASVYQQAPWGSAVTLSFSGSCSMTVKTSGVPAYHAAYYLAPAGAGQSVVATSPVTKTQLTVIAYNGSNLDATSQTFNVCPTKASSTTATGGGPIGFMITGEALFNAYELGGTPALSDNVSYTFTVNGTSQTASFIDTCNSHSAIAMNGTAQWHFHGVPTCVTSSLDGAAGPSHLIGIAMDGFPIYGGRDINGNVIAVSQLDACNGITSPTPEFPNGIYHYVLPIGVTGGQSSLNCYSGTVSAQVAARVGTYLCGLGVVTPERLAALRAAARRRSRSKISA
jgi:hypothetical protein